MRRAKRGAPKRGRASPKGEPLGAAPARERELASEDELLAAALDAADAAAAGLAGVRPARIDVKTTPYDLVTEHDVAAEALIRARLAERAPGIDFVGEETGADGAPTGRQRWLVDPIDGTVNFAHGLPVWGISIALEDDAGIAVGVVVAPALGWRFWARRGGGAFTGAAHAPEPLRVSAVDRLDRAMLATGFPYDRATNPDNNFAEWDHFQRVAGACRRLGAASLDLCLVARGWFDGYWERRLRAWDLAAGALIVVEAGGRVTDTRGGPFDPHTGEVLASNGGIHDAVIANLAELRSR